MIFRSWIPFILCLSVASVNAQDLKHKIINNEFCYDVNQHAQLDQALKVGVDCTLKLAQKKECKQNPRLCDEPKKDTKSQWPKYVSIIAGSLLLGFTIGVAIDGF